MEPTPPSLGPDLTPTNGSDQAFHRNLETGALIQNLLVIVIALVGLTGNAVVLWLLGFCSHRSPFSIYVLNLAGADFLFLSVQIIYSLERLINPTPSNSSSFPRFFIMVATFTYVTGLCILSAISTERCLSVLCPIWYRCHRPRHASAVMCTLLWALSLLLSILEGNFCGFLSKDTDHACCRVIRFVTAAWVIFSFVLLSGSSLALLVSLLCGSQRTQRLYATVSLSVLVFFLCGLPYGIYWFLLSWILYEVGAFTYHLPQLVDVLSCINSCANPIIYFFIGSFRQRQRQQRQQTLRLVLQRALQDVPDARGGSLSPETMEMPGSSKVS